MQDREHRHNHPLRRLIAAGNIAALVASDPDRFSAHDRQQVVRAWDKAMAAMRQPTGAKHG